jgi:tight adherence protein B
MVTSAVVLFLFGIGRALEPEDEVEQRLDALVKGEDFVTETNAVQEGDLAGVLLDRMEETIARRRFADSIATDLARADLTITVTEYLLARVGIIVFGFIIGFLLHRDLISGIVLGVVGIFLPVIYVRWRQRRRLTAFNSQLPDVLDHLVGSLRAGYGLLQSVEWIARQLADPAGAEFDRLVREVQLGRSLQDSLNGMVRRIDSDDLALIVTAIQIHYEVGGSLAEILETVAHTIRERVRIQREIGVLTAQQRYSGYVLMLMPIGLAIFLFLVNPEYEKQLFEPGPTLCIPIVTGIMMMVGFFVMRRIVDIEI